MEGVDRRDRDAGARRRLRLLPALAAIACLGGLMAAAAGCGSSEDSGTTGAGGAEPSAGASSAPTPRLIQRSAAARGREPGGPPGAAGACGSTQGRLATVRLNPDVPSPRCSEVSAGQRLRVLNRTGSSGAEPRRAAIELAGFRATIPPGGSVVLDAPFGTYLRPGSHELRVIGAPGPAEIRLQPGG